MKHGAFRRPSITKKMAVASVALFAAGAITPSHAEEKNQRDAVLDAAIQRIATLEAKVGRINSLEEENRQLRSRLTKTEARSETALKTSQKSLASKQSLAKPSVLATIVAPVSDAPKTTLWEGAYAGVNAGYGANNIKTYTNEMVIDKATATFDTLTNSYDTSFIGGALAGG